MCLEKRHRNVGNLVDRLGGMQAAPARVVQQSLVGFTSLVMVLRQPVEVLQQASLLFEASYLELWDRKVISDVHGIALIFA
jgi:hypothetical protein